MKKFEVNQKVFIPGIISKIDEGEYQDLRIDFEDGDHAYFDSQKVNILTEAPQQPKPPAPVRLYGYTFFDLEHTVSISNIRMNEHISPQNYFFSLGICRNPEVESSFYFEFDTKEEATAARELIEKAVLEAKGIDDDQG